MAPFTGLAPDRLRDIRRQALYADFERIDRVMSQKRITVITDHSTSELAYSTPDGRVCFGSVLADDIDSMDGIIRLVGANYHELSHHMESFEGKAMEVMDWASSTHGKSGHRAWNMLDDQRIERLFIQKWGPTSSYFTALVTKWLLGTDEEMWGQVYPLLLGRTYLDPSMLGKLRERYLKAHDMDRLLRVEQTVHRYVDLGRIDTDRKAEIARLCITDLMDATLPDVDFEFVLMTLPFHSAQAGEPVPSVEGSEDGSEARSGTSGGDHTGARSGSGSGAGGASDDGLREEAEKVVTEALADEALQYEVANRLATVRSRKTLKHRQNLPLQSGRVVSVSDETVVLMRRTAAVFRQLVIEEDPGLLTHQSYGNVSMKRAIYGVDFDTAFDRWAPGQQDSTDMEVVILVDQSQSMDGTQSATSNALWAIQRAIESTSTTSTVTVIGFGMHCRYLAPRGKRVGKSMHYVRANEGATEPLDALREAEYIFATSRHTKGTLIILTDGVWMDAHANEDNGWDTIFCDEVIARMNMAGITTALAFLRTRNSHLYIDNLLKRNSGVNLRHGVAVYTDINDPAQLVTFAKKVVGNVIKKGGR